MAAAIHRGENLKALTKLGHDSVWINSESPIFPKQ